MAEKSKASIVSKRRALGRRAKGDVRTNAVYFKSLTVENIRCFGPMQRLDLTDEKGHSAQWTVILGDNGVGKTTLLQCLAGLEPLDLSQGCRDEPMILAKAILLSGPFTISEYIRFHADGNVRIAAEICWGRKIDQNRGNIRVSELTVQTLAKQSSGIVATSGGSYEVLA